MSIVIAAGLDAKATQGGRLAPYGGAGIADSGSVPILLRERYREWRRRRVWQRLKEWEELNRHRGPLPPMEQYRWNLRGEWLRRRVERWGRPKGPKV